MLETNLANLEVVINQAWQLTEEYLESERINALPEKTQEEITLRKDVYAKKQTEFERVVENVCYLLLFQVHEAHESLGLGNPVSNESNVRRSIAKQRGIYDILRKVITTPTICSAASNFLLVFGDLATVVMMLGGQQEFTEYISWLGELLNGQIASLKTILGVENFNQYEPKELKNL